MQTSYHRHAGMSVKILSVSGGAYKHEKWKNSVAFLNRLLCKHLWQDSTHIKNQKAELRQSVVVILFSVEVSVLISVSGVFLLPPPPRSKRCLKVAMGL